MGLDNYFQPSEESLNEMIFPENIQLCGGMFSGNGNDGSFRGKVYSYAFEMITGLSLYDQLSPDDVQLSAEKLAFWVSKHEDRNEEEEFFGVCLKELRDLEKLFRAGALQRLRLVAWA